MLEKESVLQWMIDLGERLRSGDEFQLRQILPVILAYMPDFVRNQLNARRVAFIGTVKNSFLILKYRRNDLECHLVA